jgi:hypothetical protein
MSVRPEDFWSEAPPRRGTGSECEYDIQGDGYVAGYIGDEALAAAGIAHHNSFLGSRGGSGRLYPELSRFAELASRVAMGPAGAALEDLRGMQILSDIVVASGQPFRGIYRTAGTFIPNPEREDAEGGQTCGYHQNFMFPREVANDTLIDALVPTSLAARLVWAGAGALRGSGFALSQKAWGTGGNPIERDLKRRTAPGQKPMAIIPMASSDADTIGDADWARLEVRMSDPGFSLVARYLDFAATSLTLRVIELQRAGKLDGKLDANYLHGISFKRPVQAARLIAGDLSLTRKLETVDGGEATAIDTQARLLESFRQLEKTIELREDERVAIGALERIVDGLHNSNPLALQYDPRVAGAVDYAARHKFLSRDREQFEVNAYNTEVMSRDLLWGRILPAGYGIKCWDRLNAAHELTPEIGRMANDSGVSQREELRARLIDSDASNSRVNNWASYTDPLGNRRSLGSLYAA